MCNKSFRALDSYAPARSALDLTATSLDIVEDPDGGGLVIINSQRRAATEAAGWRVVRSGLASLSQAQRIRARLVEQQERHCDEDF